MSKLPVSIQRVEAYQVRGVLERTPIRACAWAIHTTYDVSFSTALAILNDVDQFQQIIDLYQKLLKYQTEQVEESEHE